MSVKEGHHSKGGDADVAKVDFKINRNRKEKEKAKRSAKAKTKQ